MVLGREAGQQPTEAGTAPEEGTEMRGPRGRPEEQGRTPWTLSQVRAGGAWKLGQGVRTGVALCRAQPDGGGRKEKPTLEYG